MIVNRHYLVLLIGICSLGLWFSVKGGTESQNPYAINLIGNDTIKSWDDIPGHYPLIAITDSEHWQLIEQLSKKLKKDFPDLTKGIFIIDYSGQDFEFFAQKSDKNNIWLLNDFDGSHYAVYPFQRIPAYYFIGDDNMARGPFYKRTQALRAMLKENKAGS